MATVTDGGSGKQLLYNTVPGDLRRPRQPVLSEPSREIGIDGESRDRMADLGRLRRADETVFAVANEFERAARIGGR